MNDLLTWLAMGGYGLYVWGSLGMCVAVFVAEGLSLRAQRRALRETLAADEGAAEGTSAHAVRQPVLTHREAT